MFKELLFVLTLLSALSGVSLSGADVYDKHIPEGLTDSLTFLKAEDSSEFPPSELLQTALAGYKMLVEKQAINRTEIITIIDYSLPSDKERLWVIDLIREKVLFRCLVSHGRNSGEIMAEKFSNTPGSNASSPGFYSTGETYTGKNGLSLALDGLETGINDNARTRSIVIHGANYVSTDFIRNNGRLGRSLGCPAVPEELSKEIIQTIKGGSCLFIYAPWESYTSNSHIISLIASVTKR
jgi:hypothetical protein